MLSSTENCVQVFCLQKWFHVSNSLQSTTEEVAFLSEILYPALEMLYPVLRAHQIPWQPGCSSPHFPTLMPNRSLLFRVLNASHLRCLSEGSPRSWPGNLYTFLALGAFMLELSKWINTTGWWENTANSPVYGETQPGSYRWGHNHWSKYILENWLTNLLQHVDNLLWEFTFLSTTRGLKQNQTMKPSKTLGLSLMVHLQTLGTVYFASS